jgi:hypothetical protein
MRRSSPSVHQGTGGLPSLLLLLLLLLCLSSRRLRTHQGLRGVPPPSDTRGPTEARLREVAPPQAPPSR